MKTKHPYHDNSMWKGAPPEGFAKAKALRNRMTDAEKALWEKLSKNQFHGYKFRRQHPLHQFIVDFYCHELKLVIEIDGEYHDTEEQKTKDIDREELIKYQKLTVIRFTNDEVLNHLDQVMNKLEKFIS